MLGPAPRRTRCRRHQLISEKCTNDDSIDLALGQAMDEHRFVIALTFEQLNTRRARRLRAMVIWEQALLNLSDEMPRVGLSFTSPLEIALVATSTRLAQPR